MGLRDIGNNVTCVRERAEVVLIRNSISQPLDSLSNSYNAKGLNESPYSDEIVRKIRERTGNGIIQIEVTSGRKKLLNDPRRAFRFCIGKDAIDSLIDYFDNHREGGWPKKGEPLWLYSEHRTKDGSNAEWHEPTYRRAGESITQFGLNQCCRRLLRRVGLIKDVSTKPCRGFTEKKG